jgi:hypothetical protein
VPTDTQSLDASERGRRAVAKRWSAATQTEKDASTAHMRAALAAKAVQRARQQAARLGLDLSDEQANAAGTMLLKNEQRDRAGQARAAAVAANAEKKRGADEAWAVLQAERYISSLRLSTSALPDGAQLRITLVALEDELAAPDGFQRGRYLRRLQTLLETARATLAAPAA